MKFPPTSDIRKIRKSLDVTQSQLASKSGISQSTIAKIEKETISASYATVVKLFETLEEMKVKGRQDITAKDVASKDIISVCSTDTVHDASELMKSTGFSQLPVIDDEKPVGSISERGIFEYVRGGMTMEELSKKPIFKIMDESYPVVNENTPIKTVTTLMSNSYAVLVAKKGKIVGLITSADMLKLI